MKACSWISAREFLETEQSEEPPHEQWKRTLDELHISSDACDIAFPIAKRS